VATFVKFPHLKGDLAAFGVALGGLIALYSWWTSSSTVVEESVLDAIVLLKRFRASFPGNQWGDTAAFRHNQSV